MAMISASSILSGPISNGLFDAVGSYRPSIYISLAICAVCAIFYLTLYLLTTKDRKKLEAEKVS